MLNISLKLLTAFALLCAMRALTAAADKKDSSKEEGSVSSEEHLIEKRDRCHRSWSRYGNRHFRYFPYHLTWAQAQRFCQYNHANLASVHNIGEYRAIQQVIYRAAHGHVETWLGGSDAQEEGYWFWIDGTPLRYTYWCPGQPDNAWQREHCMHMNWSGGRCMNDIPCTNRYPFVCVRKRR